MKGTSRIVSIALILALLVSVAGSPVASANLPPNFEYEPLTSGNLAHSRLNGVWGFDANNLYMVGDGWNGVEYVPQIFHKNGGGWTEISASLPGGLTSGLLRSIWGSSPNALYTVGFGNRGNGDFPLVYYTDGNSWTEVSLSLPDEWTEGQLYRLWGSGPSDIYAVGYGASSGVDTPLVYHNDGSDWTYSSLALPVGIVRGSLRGVWGSGLGDFYAVGYGYDSSNRTMPLLYHNNGGGWSSVNLTLPVGLMGGSLYSIWGGSTNAIYAVGYGTNAGAFPLIYHNDGNGWDDGSVLQPLAWNYENNSNCRLRDAYGSIDHDIYAVGYCNIDGSLFPLAYHHDEGGWVDISSSFPADSALAKWNQLLGLWISTENEIYAAGISSINGSSVSDYSPLVFNSDGSDWSDISFSLPGGWVNGHLNGIWGSGNSDFYAVGYGYDSTIAVPHIYHNNGSGWTDVSPFLTGEWQSGYLANIWGSSANDVYAVGYGSKGDFLVPLVYHNIGDGWIPDSPPLPFELIGGRLLSAWGSSINDIYAVGYGYDRSYNIQNPLIYHNDGGGWVDISPPLPIGWVKGHLFAVWGSGPGDIYAVGDGYDSNYTVLPLVYHNNGNGWSITELSLANGLTDGTLSGIWGTSPNNIYAIGYGTAGLNIDSVPLIYHNAGSGWNNISPPLPEGWEYGILLGLWGSGINDIYVVGYGDSGNGGYVPLIYHNDGDGWVDISPSLPNGWKYGLLHSVWGANTENVYVAGYDHYPLLYHATRDITPPVLSLPASITAEATSSDGAAVEFTVTATDETDPAPVIACDHNSGDTFPIGVTTVSCTASDASGNASEGSFTVTVYTIPTSSTGSATNITPTSAVLNGTVNPNFDDASVAFEYGLDTSYGNTLPAIPNPATGGIETPVSASLTGLFQNKTYHFRVVATNSAGTSYSNDMIFTTPYTRLTAAFKSIASQDGWTLESGENTHKGGTSYNGKTLLGKDRITDLPILIKTTDLLVGDDAHDRQLRSILSFNTSSLPGNAVLVSVTLKLKKQGLIGSNPLGAFHLSRKMS